MVAILTALWFFVVARMIRAGVWGSPEAGVGVERVTYPKCRRMNRRPL